MDPKLIAWLASVSSDPLAFVLGAFPWAEPGTSMEHETGPDTWQCEVLTYIGDSIRAGHPLNSSIAGAIKCAVASGRGIGKSTLVAWIILWSMATLPDTLGKVAANTEAQLKTVTWPALAKWFNLFIGRAHFKLTATALFCRENENTWRFDMAPWSKENTEAFQGMHNKGRRMVVLFDEASGIPDNIWDVTEGSMTDSDTQMIWCAFSNPTRNSGRFRECFPGQKYGPYWRSWQIDSRSVRITNKAELGQWVTREGEDSDWVRIHVRGIFPRVGEMEFISAEVVTAAREREATSQRQDPLVIGVDVARFGSNESVICFRKGRDARSISAIRLRSMDTVALANEVARVASEYHAQAIFVDGGGVGGGVVDNLRALHVHCFDIQFGSKADGIGFATGNEGELYAQKRSEIWGSMRAWLKTGAIESHSDLEAQLVGPTYTLNLRSEIQLEKKEDMMKRHLQSPDWADALALTFAYPVALTSEAGGFGPPRPMVESEYDPYSKDRMEAA